MTVISNPFAATLERLRAVGWYQGRAKDPATGAECLSMALQVCTTSRSETKEESRLEQVLLLRLLHEQYPELRQSMHGVHGGTIAGWNDADGRAFGEVEAVLEKCAVRWEEER